MRNKLIFLSFLIAAFCLGRCSRHKCVIQDTVTVSDTIVLSKTDTVRIYKPIEVIKRTVDTIYIDSAKNIKLPIEQKLYSRPNLYDVWVRGYGVSIDSARIYNHTYERAITNTVTRTVYKQEWGYYIYCGFKTFEGGAKPSIGLTAKSPKKWLYGAEIGLDKDNRLFYAANIGYRIGIQ